MATVEPESRIPNRRAVLGVLIGNRAFFPDELCRQGRDELLRVLAEEGIEAISLSPDDTKLGTVTTLSDAAKCAALFRANREEMDGILVTLPNFGEEKAIAACIRMAGLDVPVLVHAFADDVDSMGLEDRRDSFCGKISVCNNLAQHGIQFSLTSRHAVDPDSPSFRDDLRWFARVCRVVRSLRGVRFGAVGARPGAFDTMRYSEKILEARGISVEPIDLSEILGRAQRLRADDDVVRAKMEAIRSYTSTSGVPEAAIERMARLAAVLEQWREENGLAGLAVQCWTSIEQHYGIAPCAVMSMFSNSLVPSACEVDVPGMIGMYALQQASGGPAALLDWNNNYGDDPERCVLFHCSNLPKDVLADHMLSYQAIIAGTVGRDNSYGTIVGRIKPGPFTFARVSTDDGAGELKAYVGEGEFTDDRLDTFGGYGVAHIPRLQELLRHVCENGFEHHVAVVRSRVGCVLEEALGKYLGWNVYRHNAA